MPLLPPNQQCQSTLVVSCIYKVLVYQSWHKDSNTRSPLISLTDDEESIYKASGRFFMAVISALSTIAKVHYSEG